MELFDVARQTRVGQTPPWIVVLTHWSPSCACRTIAFSRRTAETALPSVTRLPRSGTREIRSPGQQLPTRSAEWRWKGNNDDCLAPNPAREDCRRLARVDLERGRWVASRYSACHIMTEQWYGSDAEAHDRVAQWISQLHLASYGGWVGWGARERGQL